MIQDGEIFYHLSNIHLPLFYEDMYEKVTYIREELFNPEAADTLIDAVEEAILER